MFTALRESRHPLELSLLLALALFLPLLEAPKNLAWLAYVCVWLWNRARARDFGGRWDLWDTLLALWIASGYLVAAFAAFDGNEWRGANDLVRYASVLWLVKRGGYRERELVWVAGALFASGVAATGHGLWSYARQLGAGGTPALQLKSVGHVNHSAIYLAIVLGLCVAWILARWAAWRPAPRAAALAAFALLAVGLVLSASRAAVGAGFALVLLLALAGWRRVRALAAAAVGAVALAAGAILALDAEVLTKQRRLEEAGEVLSMRDRIWRTGLAAWERHPWFGVGMSNYSQIGIEQVAAWRAEAGRSFEPGRYLASPHGHSLYVNALAERGLVGAGALFAVLAAGVAWLLRARPRGADSDRAWLLWGGAASGWFVTVAVGAVNTTLHHEHGILATLLLGLWLCRLAHRAS
jgi:O-antigen ligase